MFHPETRPGKSVLGTAVNYVSTVARRLLSPRDQKFIEAGYLTECMSFTPKFDEAVRLVALEKWGEDLAKLAESDIAEAKKTETK